MVNRRNAVAAVEPFDIGNRGIDVSGADFNDAHA